MKEYNHITGKQIDPLHTEPKLSDYYTPSLHQQTKELVFIASGVTAAGFVTYTFL